MATRAGTLIAAWARRRQPEEARAASDLDWLIPMAAASAIQIVLCYAAWRAGYATPPLFRIYGILGYTLLATIALCLFLYRLFEMARGGEERPLVRSAQMLRDNVPRILAVLFAVQVFTLGSAAFSALKTAISGISPFWFDHPLAIAEQRVFGMHPWQLSHRILGWATPAIDSLYASWLMVQVLAFNTLLIVKPSWWKTRALVSHALAWLILGVGGAYLFSSAGPIFYDRIFGGDTFAGLAAALHDAPVAIRTSDMLWRAYSLHTSEVAAGISAAPSMHVAMALWLALVLQKSRAAVLAWIYFVLIWVGSVHLGWHYFSDGLISVIAMIIIWRTVGAFSGGRGRAQAGV